MKIVSKLGIFGGTFAPVHTGHVNAAQAFWNSGLIDRLLIMPTFIPPHKTIDFQDDPKDRLNMLRIAFADFASLHPDSFEISDYEIQKGTISYTV